MDWWCSNNKHLLVVNGSMGFSVVDSNLFDVIISALNFVRFKSCPVQIVETCPNGTMLIGVVWSGYMGFSLGASTPLSNNNNASLNLFHLRGETTHVKLPTLHIASCQCQHTFRMPRSNLNWMACHSQRFTRSFNTRVPELHWHFLSSSVGEELSSSVQVHALGMPIRSHQRSHQENVIFLVLGWELGCLKQAGSNPF